jgi:predicted site-specific integrase-resolvase
VLANRQPTVKRKLISRDETAIVLGGISVRTLDRLIKRGQLKTVKLGRRHMIVADSADELATAK